MPLRRTITVTAVAAGSRRREAAITARRRRWRGCHNGGNVEQCDRCARDDFSAERLVEDRGSSIADEWAGRRVFGIAGDQSGTPAAGGLGNSPVTASKLPPMPTIASLSPQQRRIYELVFTLRNSISMGRPDEWASALRELTQLGPSAVPALCVELDRTKNDLKQRIFQMELHRIGDPRAVPTLIRAITRVSPKRYGYGSYVNDPELQKFLEYWGPPEQDRPGLFTFNLGFDECIVALEAITKHSDGQPGPGQSRAAFAKQWQRWWEENQDEVLNGADPATVDAARYDGDLVGAVGVEIMRKFFPTGPGVHLLPVHEVDILVQGFWDTPAFFSFATGELQCLDEGTEYAGDSSNWFRDNNIDITVSVFGPAPWRARLSNTQMKTWPIANERFDSIDNEVRQTKPLDFGTDIPHDGLGPQDLKTGTIHDGQYPETLFFQTANDVCGILQIVSTRDDQRAVHIRYRLWPNQKIHDEPASRPAPLPAAGSTFGEVQKKSNAGHATD